MSQPKGKNANSRRLTIINLLLNKSAGLSLIQILDELHSKDFTIGVSARTLSRDLKQTIPTEFGIEIPYIRSKKVYVIDKETLTNGMAALISTIQLTGALKNALQKHDEINEFILFDAQAKIDSQLMTTILDAIIQSRTITFLYQKFGSEEQSLKSVEPYLLKEFSGRWYLLAEDQTKKVPRTYGLDRISGLQMTTTRFDRKPNNLKQQLSETFGIRLSDRAIETIIIEADEPHCQYLKSFPLHPSQEILDCNSKTWRFSYKLRWNWEFIMELMKQSSFIKVIEPESLASELHYELRKAADKC